METYLIGKSSIEEIEFRVNETTYALVHKTISSGGGIYKTILMNQREVLNLYRAIQDEILELGVLKYKGS